MYKRQHKIQSVIIIDFETGGLHAEKNAACSVALTSYNLFGGEKISSYSSFIQPYGEYTYDDAAMKFTGITMTQLQKGKSVKQVVADLCEQFQIANTAKTHTKKPILGGHNIGFDIGFLTQIFTFCKVDIGKFLHCNKDGFGNQIPASLDTMWLSRMKWGGDVLMDKYNLTACCNKANVALTDAHDAANDVAATGDLFLTFLNDIRSDGNGTSSGEVIKDRPRKFFKI